MCLAMPVQVVKIVAADQAIVNLSGVERLISTLLLPEVQVGDYVILHVGYALTRLDEAEAKKTLALFDAMGAPT